MLGQAHVIHICARIFSVRHGDWASDKAEMVDAVLAFGKGEV